MASEIYRVETTIDCQGEMASIVMHFQVDDPTGGNDWAIAFDLLEALAAGVDPAGFIGRLSNLLSEECFISSQVAARIHPTGGNSANRVFQRDEAVGEVPGPFHTGQLAGVAIWISSTRDQVTGRNFVPGVPEGYIVGGRFLATYRTSMEEFIADVVGGYTGSLGTFIPVIWDREAELPYQIDDGYLSAKPGTQRRREKPL